jgi:hypothetical protein
MSAVITARMQSVAARASDEANAFIAWWLHELRETWRVASERFAPGQSRHFVIDLSEQHGGLATLDESIGADVPAKTSTTVLLPESSVLKCELRLPPVAERDVARVVELQLERKLPLPREQLYVDWRVREVLADRARIVDAVMARRTVVDGFRQSVRSRGWRPVVITSKEPEGRQHFNLLPAPTRRLSFAVGTRERYLAWSAVALVLFYVVVAIGKGWFDRASVSDDLEKARAQTTKIEKQRALLVTEGKPIALLHQVMAQPSAADGLVVISSALPHDSWIYQADIRALASGVTVNLEGYAPSSTSLLQGLEGSGRLDAIELVEATSAGVGSGSERVELKARLRGRAAP